MKKETFFLPSIIKLINVMSYTGAAQKIKLYERPPRVYAYTLKEQCSGGAFIVN